MDNATDEAALAAALKAGGSHRTPGELRSLIDGIAAAPPTGTAGTDEHWLAIVAPGAEPGLADRLRDLRRAATARLGGVADRQAVPRRVALLREEMARRGLQGFIVPRADEHQSESVPLCAQRLLWLTGFSGSAGVALVLADKAAIFVDGRYTLQVRSQVPAEIFTYRHVTDEPVAAWIGENLQAGWRLGYDPWLHTEGEVSRFAAACERAGGTLEACDSNPVDAVWAHRPPPPVAPIVPHDLAFAGRPAVDKRREIADRLAEDAVDATILTAPDSIAWLLNVRGGDVEHTPLPLSFATMRADGSVRWFVDERKLVPGLRPHLGNDVEVETPDSLGAAIDALGDEGARVSADPATAPVWVFDRLSQAGAKIKRAADPCSLPKACKNDVELEGMRRAHRRDAVAVARFLAWLSREGPSGRITELDVEAQLLAFRREVDLFRDESFSTISGAGPNGAIVHYRSTTATNRRLEKGMLQLVDSGAQYLDGTTDITRTVGIGTPDEEQRDRFTRVLKGHIALAAARFPKGTTGSQLDILARQHLWHAGLDFDHGTGHGVGSYLGVHEGPQRISKLPNSIALQPGMVLSNEPGYYKEGAYGIRIENLIVVQRCDALDGAEREIYDFETLTLAPIDRALIEITLLSAGEREWLDAYHARVRAEVLPSLAGADADWLAEATRPLG